MWCTNLLAALVSVVDQLGLANCAVFSIFYITNSGWARLWRSAKLYPRLDEMLVLVVFERDTSRTPRDSNSGLGSPITGFIICIDGN